VLTLGKADVQGYLLAVRHLHSAATGQVRYRSLHRFYAWAEKEGLIDRSPMHRMSLPAAERKVIPVPKRDDLRELLQACKGQSFDALRDTAILRLMAETGIRLSECAGLRVADLRMAGRSVMVMGKGQKQREVPFGRETSKALSRYLRAHQAHRLASTGMLWLGSRGLALTPNGIAQMVRRRCRQAGVHNSDGSALHPHQLRHYSASEAFRAGISDQDAKRLYGWTSDLMPSVYANATGTERAIAHARALAIGDRL
jgi:site-specific recombinase XerD